MRPHNRMIAVMLAGVMVLAATLACIQIAEVDAPDFELPPALDGSGDQNAEPEAQGETPDSAGQDSPYFNEAPESTDEAPVEIPEEVAGGLGALEQALEAVYQQVNPSVVAIQISAVVESSELIDIGGGSGFVINEQGHIVTNNHVVEQAQDLRVVFSDGTVLPATLVGRDPYSDLAVIQVDAPPEFDLVPVVLGDSNDLQVGQFVIALGSPFGLQNTMTVGIVSAIGRSLPGTGEGQSGLYSNPQIIQTDAAINPGNSGGPLVDSNGRVIGVNAAIRSETGTNSGIGFAIPVNTVKNIVSQLIERGEAAYPYLGISAQSTPTLADLATEYDVPVTRGVLVATVEPGGPAAQAGLRGGTEFVTFRGRQIALGGDIITYVDDVAVNNFDELIGYLVANTRPGQTVTLTIIRDGQLQEVELTLGERPG